MNPSSIALLIVALLMASAGQDVDRVDVLIDGSHGAASQGAVIVVDGVLDIGSGTSLDGPVYVVGGQVEVHGDITGDLVQLAGSVEIHGTVAGELRHIAGRLQVAPGARIGSRVDFEVAEESRGIGSAPSTVVTAALLAGIGFLVVRRRPEPVSNVADAAFEHPLVTLTVGVLVTVTFLAVFVFMAFTLILLPVAVLGLAVGLTIAILGLIGLGRGVGRRLPIRDDATAAGLGVAAIVVSMLLVGLVPFIGDWIALTAVMVGVGAVIVTYFGATRFEIEALPGLAEIETGD